MSLRELPPHQNVQARRANRRLSSLVLPVDKVSTLNRFIREWRHRERIAAAGIRVRNTMLLHGPSGNGKTAIAECLATEMQLPFAVILPGQLTGKYLGDTDRNILDLFRWANSTSAVVLFDEADSMASSRDDLQHEARREAVNTLLASLDGAGTNSVFLFASNYGAKLDAAVLRRMAIQMSIDAPSLPAKQELIRRLRERWKFIPDGEWIEEALRMPSFAEVELAVEDEARAYMMRDAQ